ncbi:MAG: ribonucleotide reductase N-terminal alpha domain-containing protein [Desulfohalobiaceae bacterium]
MPQDLPEPELSSNARIVLEKRYLKKDEQGQPLEDPRQMFWRVAAKIASAEDNYPASVYTPQELAREFYSLMTSFDFLPNSPTLMNAGTDLEQLAACFVLPVEDSMQGIFDAIKYAALIHKSGGGTGFSFSRLRPSKSKVGSTGGVASGPVSFLRIFNTATEQVKQGGTRRGANMGVLRVDHPDILEFIKAKELQGQLNNFNLSVALDEKFMQAVEQDREYSLIAPHTGQEKGRLRAREVFTLLVQKAWEGGDPGIIFIDRINRDNPTPAQGEIESTNPCVTADTFVCTSKGPRQVQDLLDRQFTAMVQGQLYPSREQGFFYTGRKPILALRTQEGYQVKLTWEHPVCRAASVHRSQVRTEWIKAGELEPGDRILLGNQGLSQAWSGKYGRNEGYLMGLLLGDGVLKEDKAVVSVWTRRDSVNGSSQEDSQVMRTALECARNMPHRRDFQGWQKIEGRQEQRLCLASLKAVCLDLGLTPGNKRITPKLEKCSSEFCSAFLSGLFDADGSVQGTAEKGFSVRLAQSDLQTLQAVQRMLLRLGIKSVIYRERRQAGTSQLPDGRGSQQDYAIRAQHELVISRENLQAFQEHIGFQDQDKAGRLQAFLKSYTRGSYRERFLAIVESLEQLGEEDVYDVQIPEANAFCANGLLLHNCGEQPLLPYEACNLGSLNVARFYSPEARDGVNWERLAERIRLCVRFLDNVIDCSRYPLQQIQDKVHQNRKIGLGLMGWADLLFQLKIPYNSRKALDLGQKLMQFLREQSWAASKELAEERGAFPGYEQSIFKQKEQGPFRNATTTTIAPTGTLSILAGCSSGIEPLFALSFVRQVLDGERLMELNPYFEKVLQESQYYSQQLMRDIAEKGSIRGMDFLPEELRQIFVTAMDIESRWHLEMQVAFQKFTDNAVSKTVNLPNSATQKDIYDIYWSAYELGCKGVTVYRDGSRQEQVLSTGQGQSQDRDRTKVKERPEVLYGFTQKVSTGLGELYLTVNEVDGQPFEVFATIGRSGRSITAKAEAIGRLVSLALRSGIHVRDVVKQLKGIGGEHPVFQKKGLLLSIPDAVAWVLENRYLSNQKTQVDNHSLGSPKCPECGVALLFQEGCFFCQACGYTKCG